ncbi:CPBP family intramembrane glutamic endopeptidase [Micromonospora sp. NPDC093277]|uniref:CPBP family intramembrane glutamic endopeptidase n=1 Tax=Micromonospora sp. NPDC093277 TaxID=3364291 RepID=UPI00381886AF
MADGRPADRSPLRFFLLVFALAIPFWLLQPLTEGVSDVLPMRLPSSAAMFVCPFIAALILTRTDRRPGSTRRLLRHSVSRQGIDRRRWYLPALLIMPVLMLLSYVVARAMDDPVPAPRFDLTYILVACTLFAVAGLMEEVGWMGYLGGVLQQRRNALWAATLLGTVWAVWHIVPYAQAGHSVKWITWQCVLTVALRVIIFWLYNNNAGSVLLASLFHASINVSDALYPVDGSAYNPVISGAVIVLAAIVIAFLWGPTTLTRFRWSSSHSGAPEADPVGRETAQLPGSGISGQQSA